MRCPNCNSSGMHAVPPSDKEHERISHECRACGYQEHKTKELADAYLVRCEGCGTHRLRVPELGTGARCSIHPDAKQIIPARRGRRFKRGGVMGIELTLERIRYGAECGMDERARIVLWLRMMAMKSRGKSGARQLERAAAAIEDGEHLR